MLLLQLSLQLIVQVNRSQMPILGTCGGQLFIQLRTIDAYDSICYTYSFIFREPWSKPTYFEWQQQIKVLLCYLCTHSFISFDSTNFMASSDFSVFLTSSILPWYTLLIFFYRLSFYLFLQSAIGDIRNFLHCIWVVNRFYRDMEESWNLGFEVI